MTRSAPYDPLGHAPLRRPHSIRRTSSMQATWPQGRGGPIRIEGAARDVATFEAGASPVILAEDRLSVLLDAERIIQSIHAGREVAGLAALQGRHSIAGLRGTIAAALADEAAAGTPLYSLAEDVPGTSLICDFAWARWPEYRADELRIELEARSQMQGVCMGFAPGGSSLSEQPTTISRKNLVPSPVHPQDPQGWHELPVSGGVDMCRIRRIDVWHDNGFLHVDAMFQDSGSAPGNTREAAHEYSLTATIDAQREILVDVQPRAHILPYRECPGAIANVHRVLGTPLSELRLKVLQTLRRTDGCTHLNDAVRALAELPRLARPLLQG